MILLIERLSPNEGRIITEATEEGKNVYLSGIFMQAEIKNQNGRIYPINELKNAVESAQKMIKSNNGLLGELDHPQTLTINLDRVSHVIEDLRLEGNNAVGKARLLDTPMGKIAKELVKSGVSLGVSSRGAGMVNEQGYVSGYKFITIDIVATPSAPGAVPEAIYESLDRAKNGKVILDLAEAVREDQSAQEFLKKEILNWLKETTFKKVK